ncbi:hypothetical protein CPB86DRAFT_876117 [Serendipita vermifera]|nr:hypothetical protein CPB86DRAFT_876117 [Serendipita vermifera]
MSQSYRVFALAKKGEEISDEEFRRIWEKAQAPKVLPLMKKHGATYYSQTYMNRDSRDTVSRGLFKDDAHTADYDGISTTDFPSLEAADAYLNDPELKEISKENPWNFFQVSVFRATGGEEVVLLDLRQNKPNSSL